MASKCPVLGVYGPSLSDEDQKHVLNLVQGTMHVLFFRDESTVRELYECPVRFQRDIQPQVRVTVSSLSPERDWPFFCRNLTDKDRRGWLHVQSVRELNLTPLWIAFMHSVIGPQEEIRTDRIPLDPTYLGRQPLVSVFTTTFRSGERILRPLASLQAQTYHYWEWVILDDSDDDGKTWNSVLSQPRLSSDRRIRRYLPARPCGYIGQVKKQAAGLCQGQILVELDHDDELEPDCLELLVKAYREHPDCGCAYTDFTEIQEVPSRANFAYADGYGMGYGSYYKQLSTVTKTWVNVGRTPDLNAFTSRDIVGVPNHIRSWRTDFYHLIGGHNPDFSVGDDYELLTRSWLRGSLVRVPTLSYIQYRNDGGNNWTFLRNQQIRILQAMASTYYRPAMLKKLQSLGLPLFQSPGLPIDTAPHCPHPTVFWECLPGSPMLLHVNRIHHDPNVKTWLVVTSSPSKLRDFLAWQQQTQQPLSMTVPSSVAFAEASSPTPSVVLNSSAPVVPVVGSTDHLVVIGFGGFDPCTMLESCPWYVRQSSGTARRVRHWSLSSTTDPLVAIRYGALVSCSPSIASTNTLVYLANPDETHHHKQPPQLGLGPSLGVTPFPNPTTSSSSSSSGDDKEIQLQIPISSLPPGTVIRDPIVKDRFTLDQAKLVAALKTSPPPNLTPDHLKSLEAFLHEQQQQAKVQGSSPPPDKGCNQPTSQQGASVALPVIIAEDKSYLEAVDHEKD